MHRFEARKNVDVVIHAADRMRNTIQSSDYPAQIGMEPRPKGSREPRFALLRAEDNVVMQRRMGRGHSARFSRPAGAQTEIDG